ncbi:MAG TPA: EAL domain-containing protein [Xanthobacteraceae bacterium]|nr:EAL domain-containing protein [Xanthobacteraceae bacterium]
MVSRRHGLAHASLVAASVAFFLIAGHFAATALLDAQRTRQLKLVNELALRTSEAAASFGAATLEELIASRAITCDSAALQAVRLHVYQRGAIKDIRILNRDGGILCSAYSETLEFDKQWATRDQMLPTPDRKLRLFRVEQFFGTALGIVRDIDNNTSLAAILGFNGNSFDFMPADLREHSEVTVELGDGRPIVRSSHTVASVGADDLVSINSSSGQFPLRTITRVEKAAFGQWNDDFYLPIMGMSALLGLAFGALLCRAVIRADNPVAELDRALRAGEFAPYMQAIFDLQTREIVGCEALVRWIRPNGEVIPPSRFIRLAESSGRVEPMTWQILNKSLDVLATHMRRDKQFKLSINIMPQHLVSQGFIDTLRNIVAQTKVSSRQIVLELTERHEFEDLARTAETIRALGDLGFRIAMDDVGTGHNGLSQIQALGANIMKIDKFFTDAICRDQTAVSMVEMLVKLAGELNMTTVAEGIETEEQAAALLACGVTHGQGYLVSQPLPAASFLSFLDWKSHLHGAATKETESVARVA